jgi:hypothetical protein
MIVSTSLSVTSKNFRWLDPQPPKKSEQYRCQPVCLGNTGVCRLGGVESIYTSVSARYVVRCPEWQRVTDQINAAAVSLCNTETGDLRIADSSSRNAVSFSSARRTNASRRRDPRRQSRLFDPLELTAETRRQLQRALLRLSAISSQYFTAADSASFALHTAMTK